MKVRISLTETKRVTIKTHKKSVVIDTDTMPIFKGKTNVQQIQDVLYYEFLNPQVMYFLEALETQESEKEERETEEDAPVISVEKVNE